MIRLRLLLKNINVINVVLTAALVIFVVYILLPSTRPDMEYTPAPLKQEVPDIDGDIAVTDDRQNTNQLDFTVIAERNLFHPNRKIPEPEPEKKEPEERPDFILYGTMLVGGAKIAYMEDGNSPKTTPGRGKRQKAVKEGDVMSGYVLSLISHDRVVMMKGEDTIEVPIVNPSKPKKRSGAVKKAAPKKRSGATAKTATEAKQSAAKKEAEREKREKRRRSRRK
jgi:hypothetical protein